MSRYQDYFKPKKVQSKYQELRRKHPDFSFKSWIRENIVNIILFTIAGGIVAMTMYLTFFSIMY